MKIEKKKMIDTSPHQLFVAGSSKMPSDFWYEYGHEGAFRRSVTLPLKVEELKNSKKEKNNKKIH